MINGAKVGDAVRILRSALDARGRVRGLDLRDYRVTELFDRDGEEWARIEEVQRPSRVELRRTSVWPLRTLRVVR